MRVLIIVLIGLCLIACSCSKEQQMAIMDSDITAENPLLGDWDTPYGVPPFGVIKECHYMPAFEVGMAVHRKEIEAIASNPAAATFANTIEAMDRSGEALGQVSGVFYNMLSSMSNDSLQAIAKEIAPKLSKHGDDISMNVALFARVKAVYQQKDSLGLDGAQAMLLEKTYKGFVRGGANLQGEPKAQLRKINEELSVLSLQFGEHILKENNRFTMVLEHEADLAGLPGSVRAGAAETAIQTGHKGKWVFTLQKPSLIPFLQYSQKRDLREKMFKGYINKGDNNDDLDNKNILAKMAALRVTRANLLGFDSHADYALDVTMAKSPGRVYELLNKVWPPALARANQEVTEMQAIIDREGGGFKLRSWDWLYYAEKLRMEKYDLDENMLRPYFKMENVRAGAFDLAGRLWGITFDEIDIPKYHKDVTAYAVKEADGSLIGLFYTDYYPRASKRGGAWMNSFRKQVYKEGKRIAPVICNVGNFSRPIGDKPALLSYDEVNTLFHEFGHALHGLLSNCKYKRLSGTSVPRDFVELPSQIMENWAGEPEMLRLYARHYQTGEVMPDALIEKIQKARYFNQGFATVEYLAASYLDMDWHTLKKAEQQDVTAFENRSLTNIGLIPEIISRYRSTYFQHIFSGGYSSGYYSYLWAEVLDADAFDAFKAHGIFDKQTGGAFRQYILSAGGTDDPMVMYKRFRGAEPGIKPLLKRRGLLPADQ